MLLRHTTNCIWVSLLHMCFLSDPVKQIKQLPLEAVNQTIVGVNKKLRT